MTAPTEEKPKSVIELKAECYDLIAEMEFYQQREEEMRQKISAKNQEIRIASQQK